LTCSKDEEKVRRMTSVIVLLFLAVLITVIHEFNVSTPWAYQGQFVFAVDANRDTSQIITKVTPVTHLAANTSKATKMAGTDDQNRFTINLRIRGIDYLDNMALVWITVRNQTVAYNINPIALLDPQDNGDGIIHVPVTFPQDIVHPGDQYTACIKILVQSDNLGDTFSCQKGIDNLAS
jgi:hypothetical protein